MQTSECIHAFFPYLFRATYDWLADNNLTIYVEVDTTNPQVIVPSQHATGNLIILDITPEAVNKLKINNTIMEFEARFNNKIVFISIPLSSVISIYNPQYEYGIKFQPTINIAIPLDLVNLQEVPKDTTNKTPQQPSSTKPKSSKKPKLTLLEKPTD